MARIYDITRTITPTLAVWPGAPAFVSEKMLSLDEGAEPGAEDAWGEELGRRAQAVADGTATLVDWADAEKRISARLRARRETRATR